MANYSAIPLFKSHYSLGKSVLTLNHAGPSGKDEPSSVFNIAEKLKLKSVTLVEDSMSGFLEAYKSSQNLRVKLQFGLRITLCDQISKKTSESRTKEHKVVIFAKNGKGYYDLIKISTIACNEGFYYYPRIDTDSLKRILYDEDLDALCKLPKVGRKTGEKIIIDIRHKIKTWNVTGVNRIVFNQEVMDSAVNALVSIGVPSQNAKDRAKELYTIGMNVSELVNAVLRK